MDSKTKKPPVDRNWTYRSIIKDLVLANRGLAVLFTVTVELFLLGLFYEFELFRGFLTAVKENNATAILPLLLAAPVAFVIWIIRDASKQLDQNNTKHDLYQKDFHQLQEWATATPKDGEEPVNQLAALHQLVPYFIGGGEIGDRFRRPAFEIYKALLESWRPKEGESGEGSEDAEEESQPPSPADDRDEQGETTEATESEESAETAEETAPAEEKKEAKKKYVQRPKRPMVIAIHQIIIENLKQFGKKQTLFRTEENTKDNLLQELYLEGIEFPEEADLKGIDLSEAHLEGADLSFARLDGAKLWKAHLDGANLWYAHLDGADLGGARLDGANLSDAHLDGANLRYAHLDGANLSFARLDGANLSYAHLEGAYLSYAHLEGAKLWNAHLDGANLLRANLEKANLIGARMSDIEFDEKTSFSGAVYNEDTVFPDDFDPEEKGMRRWDSLSYEEKKEYLKLWG